MSIYIEEMLSRFMALDGFCERLEEQMAIEPLPAGLLTLVDDLTTRIGELEQHLPDEVRLEGWDRKLHWIRYWLEQRDPQSCVGDLDWLRTSIIPTTSERLKAWGAGLAFYDEELRRTVAGLVRTGEFASAIRHAFVLLTERLRSKYGLRPGTDGPELVNQIYGKNSALTEHMGGGERQAMRDYLSGAYGVLRNKYAHGNPPRDLTEFDAALATVNLALKRLAAA